MHNEYGTPLDSNGYAPTLLPAEPSHCYRCGFWKETARHEVFGGTRRNASKVYGLWVNVCPTCHEILHQYGSERLILQREAQSVAMLEYHWTADEFRRRFGKNYLTED